ncbi:MAG: anaerobic ribonucleoside-triphosphate reductase [Candidatus Bathyarchaeia archaeon]
MSVPQRVRGVRILKAVSSPLRLQILNLLFDEGPLSYTELMGSLKMNPSRDAGRFAYHLKFLLKADLIEADVEARKYRLTELGKMVIDVADKIDKKAFKPRSALVRTSRLALEEFDANKIASSLTREAKMPAELAQRVAKEAEKQLIRARTKYLTAPLVREVVNAILIEKGLEEYRHKLTRLGIPVHDVTSLLESRNITPHETVSAQESAGETVFKEYTLLNILPRDVSDAHLSGSLHLNGLSSWILKPNEIMHDLRFFLGNGLDLERIDPLQQSQPAPQNFQAALSLTFNVLLHSAKEVDTMQTLDYFNVFLAPFAKDAETSKVKEALRLFTASLAQHAHVSLGLELTVPDFLAEKQAVGPGGKPIGTYADFTEQVQLLASLLLEVFAEEGSRKPLTDPELVLKIRAETTSNERAKALLLKAHSLASERGVLYFANALKKERKHSVFSSSGLVLDTDLSGDWEIDTLRTGCLGVVTINVPRIAYESCRDQTKFLEILKERIEMADRALEIKHRALTHRGKNLLPFIMQGGSGDQYFRLESCSRIINLAGLKQGAEMFCEKSAGDEKTLAFSAEIARDVSVYVQKIGRRRGKRLSAAMLPNCEASKRLAQMDIERYGVAKVKFSGVREKPFYSTANRIPITGGRVAEESLTFEDKLAEAHVGGSLTVVDLGESKHEPEELMAITRQLTEGHNVDVFTYDRKLTYCVSCKKSWFGLLHKCPSCGAVGTLAFLDRFMGT